MKRRIVALLLLTVTLAGLLSGCGGILSRPEPIYTPGRWEEDHYENALMELSFSPPEGWEVLSKEELKDMDTAADKALEIEKGGTGEEPESFYHYEFSGKDPETGAGLLILAVKTAMNADDYKAGLKSGAKGGAFVLGEAQKLDLGDKEYLMLPLTVEGEDTPYQQQYVRKEGSFLINIMMFSTTDSPEFFAQMEDCFTQLSA